MTSYRLDIRRSAAEAIRRLPPEVKRAVKAGATAVSEPAAKPWGQTVAYLRDKDGHLVELCTPL